MTIPLQITASDFKLSETIEETIREKAEKLGHLHDRILKCRVRIEAPHHHQHKGILYNIRIDMTIPGGELVVNKVSHEDLNTAIHIAFDRAIRRLEDHLERRRIHTKPQMEDLIEKTSP
jgi:ribosomal subunit interface protein